MQPFYWNAINPFTGTPFTWNDPNLRWGSPSYYLEPSDPGFTPYPNQLQPKPKKRMPQLRVLLGFTNAPDHSLEETTGAVSAGLFGHASYPTPPVTQIVLDAALLAFTQSIAAAAQGGPADTADKNNKRDALVDLLRQLAGYVQSKHGNDMAVLLASGFDAVSTNHASTPLTAPTIRDILNGNSGQLILRVTPIRNANSYETRYAAIGAGGAPGPWQSGGLHSNSRSISINGLTPGTNYTFQVRAVGGSTGYSDWSDAVSHVSM